jgi:nucleoside-diphosphate-sugar epimerase
MRSALVTGGSGFFGSILKRALLERGWRVANVDLLADEDRHEQLTSIVGDAASRELIDRVCSEHRPEVIFHVAAMLAHAVKDEKLLWRCNVETTRAVADVAKSRGVAKIVFTSSNCLWGEPFGRPVREDDPPRPVEIYGESKLEAERILHGYDPDVKSVILRCPTIIDRGRLGLLAILFEFIDEGRRVWVVGKGDNRYQFIAAEDLVDACIKAADHDRSAIFGIGSSDVPELSETYQYVIDKASSGSRVAHLPKGPALLAMRVAHGLGVSPLGPYQYKMIAESFAFDTSAIQRELGWQATLTNQEMLWRAYQFFRENRSLLPHTMATASALRQPAKMGIIRLLKWIS